MLAENQVEALGLAINPINDDVLLCVESAIEWIKDNTSYCFDLENLQNTPASVRMFIKKFCDIQLMDLTVSSESIEGLSQSFNTTNSNEMIFDLAGQLLKKWMSSNVEFFQSRSRW